ncbi:DUF2946 family protein [Ramlibacter terrae]|uniref:DUF2946 family protein n=1 Tax=Ramlibacter terrae TaxID=2732511 RepID=A0ABX6P242_9BURK|nr:DUF2946 family protein [Ramlibacter terrae]
MDDIVRQAMAKWPNVPHCYGWLGLDERGNWYMRDDRVQAGGPFPQSKGSLLRHEKLVDFIHRNYDRDDRGQWFFQNGPQRVYVELQATPRSGGWGPATRSPATPAAPRRCRTAWSTRRGACTGHRHRARPVHTLDIEQAADAIEQGTWQPREVAARDLPGRFGYVASPAAAQ